jgi:hypothetical protein
MNSAELTSTDWADFEREHPHAAAWVLARSLARETARLAALPVRTVWQEGRLASLALCRPPDAPDGLDAVSWVSSQGTL